MYNRIICLAVLLSALLFAHEGMEHVMGTVSAVSKTSVTVETIQHKSITVLLDSSTKFTHGAAQSSLKDLKVGDRVVIHAKFDPNKNLLGILVKWGAGSPQTKETMNQ
ncbi:MAG TPA: DUF5666 domain-containing protein [Bryobacteraceae bacterium]|nr:DUF5666 domain-containing protein [Bryobacteraceae bacterium]